MICGSNAMIGLFSAHRTRKPLDDVQCAYLAFVLLCLIGVPVVMVDDRDYWLIRRACHVGFEAPSPGNPFFLVS